MLLLAVTLVPYFIGLGGWVYTAIAAVTGVWFLALAIRVAGADGVEMKKRARSLFTYSLAYMFVIFLAFVLDHGLHLVGVV